MAEDAEILATIKSLNENFSDNFENGKFEAMAEAYTSDAILLSPGRPEIFTGRKDIQSFWEQEKPFRKLKFETVNVKVLGGTSVREVGVLHLTMGGRAQPVRGKYVSLWEQINGDWKRSADIWNMTRAGGGAGGRGRADDGGAGGGAAGGGRGGGRGGMGGGRAGGGGRGRGVYGGAAGGGAGRGGAGGLGGTGRGGAGRGGGGAGGGGAGGGGAYGGRGGGGRGGGGMGGGRRRDGMAGGPRRDEDDGEEIAYVPRVK